MRFAALLLAAALAGCSTLQSGGAVDSEELLTQAGFERQPLHEPGLPSRQLVLDGSTYKFADPDFCACVYVGGAAEYARLETLRAERVAERDWIQSRNSIQGSPPDRTLWGAWKPAGLDAIEPAAVGR